MAGGPYFTEEERAALALAEAATRLADRPDAVSDEIWDTAATYFDEKQLAAIVLMVGVTNLFNRLNATTRQIMRRVGLTGATRRPTWGRPPRYGVPRGADRRDPPPIVGLTGAMRRPA